MIKKHKAIPVVLLKEISEALKEPSKSKAEAARLKRKVESLIRDHSLKRPMNGKKKKDARKIIFSVLKLLPSFLSIAKEVIALLASLKKD